MQAMNIPVVGFPSGQREQTVNLPSSTSKVRILPPPPLFTLLNSYNLILPLVGFPSGQREQTVNLPSSTSKVRILPPPPSLPDISSPPNKHQRRTFCPYGKDEKLRPGFDSSVSERTLPQATARRVSSKAANNPSPTTITSRYPVTPQTNTSVAHSAHPGRMRSFDQGSTRASAKRPYQDVDALIRDSATSAADGALPASFLLSRCCTGRVLPGHPAGYQAAQYPAQRGASQSNLPP